MNQLALFLPLLVMLALIMFFGSRRQKRAMQSTIDLHESLRIGDRVHTTSGLQGTITNITDDDVQLEIADGVVTTWMKLAIRDRIEGEAPETSDDEVGEADEAVQTGQLEPADGHGAELQPDLLVDRQRLPKD
jgi:preprotein translocase subunit YajC